MKHLKLLFFALLFANSLQAEVGCEILVKLEYYAYDTLWFGTTVGKRQVPDFFGVKQADGSFLLKTDKALEQGMYAIIYKRAANTNYQSFQVWLADGQRKFSIATKMTATYYQPIIVGSPENELLHEYLGQFTAKSDSLEAAINRWRYFQDADSWQKRVEQEELFQGFQADFVKKATPSLTATLVGQTMLPLPPASTKKADNWEKAAAERWAYQRAHYFEKMDIASPDFLRYPQWLDRADFFLLYLPPPHPDTTKALCDLLFKRLEAYPDGYNYYQKYIFTSLAKMSQYRLDEVYVYIEQNYLSTGKATWADASTIRNAHTTALQSEKLFEGSPSPDVTLFQKDNIPVRLYDIPAKLTLLIFYMPDCGHCKKEIPLIAKFYEKYKDQGLKVVAVCLKTMADTPQCWDYTDSQNLPKDWYLLADPDRKANLSPTFNIKSFPRMLLLDADKKILYKRSGDTPEWQLDALLGRFLR